METTNKELNDFLSKFPSIRHLINEAIWVYDFERRWDEYDFELEYNPDDYIDEDEDKDENGEVLDEVISERIDRQIIEGMRIDIIEEMEDDIEEFKTYILSILMNKLPANCIKELKEFLNQNITQEIFDEVILDILHS